MLGSSVFSCIRVVRVERRHVGIVSVWSRALSLSHHHLVARGPVSSEVMTATAPSQSTARFFHHTRVSGGQTTTSAVGPNAFYASDEPITSKRGNIPCNPDSMKSEAMPAVTSPDILAKSYIDVRMDTHEPCKALLEMHAMATKMNEVVFFYNEKTPHLGMMLNIKEHLYNYYCMVGPVRTAWYQILCRHEDLTNLLRKHLLAKNSSCDTSAAAISILLDSIQKKKGVSSCKYEKSVREGNLIQFKYSELLAAELIFLQVFAQYAHYDYEII